MVPGEIRCLAMSIAAAGGRAIIVGGWVRDRLLGIESKDLDVEVYGLSAARLEEVLRGFGEVIGVGRSFGVLKVKGIDADFSIPRRDSKAGRGHRGFIVEFDPAMTFAYAARRRDLTINAMGFDPITEEVLDPHGGRRDLEARTLRAVDRDTFPEDSLRALRAAGFAARFEMEADGELVEICSRLDLSDLPGERILEEYAKLLLKGRRPSLGLRFLERTGLLRFFPEIAAMVGVPQDPGWHPEGTVWEHVLLVVDEAARLRSGRHDEDLALMLGALLHDVGKPPTTVIEDGDRIRSPGHEDVGVPLAEAFLGRLRAPLDLTARVAALVRHHLAPATFIGHGASPKAYRRLARKLSEAGVTAREVESVARADHFGRTTHDALARQFPEGERFLQKMEELRIVEEAEKDVVMGRHLIARGMAPGAHFGPILARCRDVQDETGLKDSEAILRIALDEADAPAPASGNETDIHHGGTEYGRTMEHGDAETARRYTETKGKEGHGGGGGHGGPTEKTEEDRKDRAGS